MADCRFHSVDMTIQESPQFVMWQIFPENILSKKLEYIYLNIPNKIRIYEALVNKLIWRLTFQLHNCCLYVSF